ncbi:hypothetical protein COSO111634_27205 [Corallococcus soli]
MKGRVAAAFQSTSTQDRSSASISGRRLTGTVASCATASSRTRSCDASRAAVVGVKTSRLYSSVPSSPPSRAIIDRLTSKRDVSGAVGSSSTRTPGSAGGGTGALCSANITWNSDARSAPRSAPRASTSRSNGTSWCAYAASEDSRTRSSSSVKRGSPSRRARSTSVLRNTPMSGSSSGRVRWATGLPTAKSSCPE